MPQERRGPRPWGLYYAMGFLALLGALIGFWLGVLVAVPSPPDYLNRCDQTPVPAQVLPHEA